MERSLLVTGGAGFIGSTFVRMALASDLRVVVADKLTYSGSLDNLADVSGDSRFAFEHVDICDRGAVDGLFRRYRPTWVINLAAETHVDRSIDGPRALVATNVLGTFELLDAALRYWFDLDHTARAQFRFLHVSTDEVYGTLGTYGAFSEETPYAPNSPYAATKAGGDHLARAYHQTFGLPVLLTNCSNNYGPFQFPEKLLPLMLLNALEGRRLPIYGDGRQVRDWLFVEDHCAALLLVLASGRVGERYNIGGGGERTNLEMVDALCEALERAAPALSNAALRGLGMDSYLSLKTFVTDRPGHDRRYAIDSSKIRSELGWAPSLSIQDGLERTVRWYLSHQPWCENIQRQFYSGERLGLKKPHAFGETT